MLAARALLILVRRRCVVAVHMPACGLNEFLSRTVAIMMAINTQNEPRTIGGLEAVCFFVEYVFLWSMLLLWSSFFCGVVFFVE